MMGDCLVFHRSGSLDRPQLEKALGSLSLAVVRWASACNNGKAGGGMPAPRWVARFNKAGLNKLTPVRGPAGRRMGCCRPSRTQVRSCFPDPGGLRRGDSYVIAPDLRHGLGLGAQRHCRGRLRELESRGRHYRLADPRIYHDETAADMPPIPSGL